MPLLARLHLASQRTHLCAASLQRSSFVDELHIFWMLCDTDYGVGLVCFTLIEHARQSYAAAAVHATDTRVRAIQALIRMAVVSGTPTLLMNAEHNLVWIYQDICARAVRQAMLVRCRIRTSIRRGVDERTNK